MTAELAMVAGMGLLASAHCLGMCGGFAVLAHSGRGMATTGVWLVGKTMTYAAMGAAAGGFGHLLAGFAGAQRVLILLVGVILVAIGLATAGVIPDRLPGAGSISRALGRTMGRFVRVRGNAGALALGLVNGLLPCGLVYAAVAHAAAAGTAAAGLVVMTVFGLATAPVLALTGWASGRVAPVVLRRVARAGGWLVVLLGLATLGRAWMAGSGPGAHGL